MPHVQPENPPPSALASARRRSPDGGGRPCRPVLYRRPQAEYALPGAVPRPGGGRLLLAGEIDWPTLAGQSLSFAFIKATEGSGFTDPRFSYNWEEARKTALRVGAYHFFSYDSPGKTQADNFIAAVPREPGALPPVVDVEFYGDKAADPPAAADVHPQLDALLRRLEAHYGVRPILYATGKAYRLYLEGRYDDYDLWIRDVYFTPSLSASRPWTFWQYADNARLQGYTGREPCIDMNVFSGTPEEFAAYVGVPA